MVAGGRELIDTLWNVNYNVKEYFMGEEHGINRYIMECKFGEGKELLIKYLELIDTLWNVNQTFTKKMRGATMN